MTWLRRSTLVVLVCLLAFPTAGHGPVPNIGDIMWASVDRDQIRPNCPLSYDFDDHRFQCATISISRPADSMNLGMAAPATLVCGEPCYLEFSGSDDKCVGMDFITPSFEVEPDEILLSWNSGAGAVAWTIDWCQYAAGEAICAPDGTNLISEVATAEAANARTDTTFDLSALEWVQDSHVVIRVCRNYDDAGDTVAGIANLETVRMEFN